MVRVYRNRKYDKFQKQSLLKKKSGPTSGLQLDGIEIGFQEVVF